MDDLHSRAAFAENLKSRYSAPENTSEWLDLLTKIDEAEEAGKGAQ